MSSDRPFDPTRAEQATTAASEEEATREEMIDTLLHPDRAKHDELGRTVARGRERPGSEAPAPGPREQAAAPIDVSNVDE